jgi:hypothetical protein
VAAGAGGHRGDTGRAGRDRRLPVAGVLVLLESLSLQRAAFLLREVFEYP